MNPVKRICVFEHSVMTNFNCACLAIQRGQGSGETARMRRLAWTFAARIGDKYQIRLTQSILLDPLIFFFYFINNDEYIISTHDLIMCKRECISARFHATMYLIYFMNNIIRLISAADNVALLLFQRIIELCRYMYFPTTFLGSQSCRCDVRWL